MRHARGTTLVEVVISILIVAMMTVPIMSTVLSGAMAAGRTQRRLDAAAAVRRVSENLKAYVTADRSIARGPGVGNDGWNLPDDASGQPALQSGHHVLAPVAWLPTLAPAPYLGKISYDVTARMTPLGPEPDVSFSVAWTEP